MSIEKMNAAINVALEKIKLTQGEVAKAAQSLDASEQALKVTHSQQKSVTEALKFEEEANRQAKQIKALLGRAAAELEKYMQQLNGGQGSEGLPEVQVNSRAEQKQGAPASCVIDERRIGSTDVAVVLSDNNAEGMRNVATSLAHCKIIVVEQPQLSDQTYEESKEATQALSSRADHEASARQLRAKAQETGESAYELLSHLVGTDKSVVFVGTPTDIKDGSAETQRAATEALKDAPPYQVNGALQYVVTTTRVVNRDRNKYTAEKVEKLASVVDGRTTIGVVVDKSRYDITERLGRSKNNEQSIGAKIAIEEGFSSLDRCINSIGDIRTAREQATLIAYCDKYREDNGANVESMVMNMNEESRRMALERIRSITSSIYETDDEIEAHVRQFINVYMQKPQ